MAPHGRVMVTDLDTRFLSDLAGLPGVQVRQADITSDPLPPDAFDLIHARAVLEHLPDREQVISALAAGLRPGGVLLVEDTVIGGDFGRAAEPMVHPRRLAEAFIRVVEAVSAGFRAVGADPRFGPRLPGLLNDTGLTRVGAAFVSRLVTGGSPESEFYTFTLAELSERLVAAGVLDAADADLIGEMTLNPDARWPSLGLVIGVGVTENSLGTDYPANPHRPSRPHIDISAGSYLTDSTKPGMRNWCQPEPASDTGKPAACQRIHPE